MSKRSDFINHLIDSKRPVSLSECLDLTGMGYKAFMHFIRNARNEGGFNINSELYFSIDLDEKIDARSTKADIESIITESDDLFTVKELAGLLQKSEGWIRVVLNELKEQGKIKRVSKKKITLDGKVSMKNRYYWTAIDRRNA